MIGQLGVEGVYWANATTFLAVIAALLMMRIVERHTAERPKVSIAAMVEGLKFVRRARMIYSTMLLDFIATFFSSTTALLPVFAREVLHVGPEQLGILYAAEAVGSLLAGVVISSLGEIRRKGWVMLWSVAAYGAATAIYGFSQDFWLSLLMPQLVCSLNGTIPKQRGQRSFIGLVMA